LVQTSDQFAASINQGWNSPGNAGSQCNGDNNPGGGGGGSGGNNNGNTDPPQIATNQPSNTDPPQIATNPPQIGNGNNGNPSQPSFCLDLREQCDFDLDCCSAQCRGGQCWDSSSDVDTDDGGNAQNCQDLEQPCNRNSHCCSGLCNGGACWDPSVQQDDDNTGGTDDGGQEDDNAGGTDDDGQPQQQGCDFGQEGAQCFRNMECCSGVCLNGLCRGTTSRANQQPNVDDDRQQAEEPAVCATYSSSCQRSSDCCSRRCWNGECQRSSNLRRATSNEYWRIQEKSAMIESHEPRFSSPALDARWVELMSLYNGTRPDLVFEILGREDCVNRSQGEHHAIESASPEWIHSLHLPNETEHAFDCHYVIAH
jgi:hypothetical protein